jgi:hypothetical protein
MPFMFPFLWWKWWKNRSAPAPEPAPGSPRFFRWFHRDGDLDGTSYAALVTAMRGDWTKLDQKTRMRQFRAFVLLSLRIAPLSPEAVELGDLRPELYSNDERNAAGSAIARTLVLLAPSGLRAISDAQTDEGKPAGSRGVTDTGELVTVIIVAMAALSALAAVYLAAEADVRINFDDEVTQRLLSSQAKAIEVLTLHIERERVVGHELPFDDAERGFLMRLQEDQARLATLQGRPRPNPLEGARTFVQQTASSLTTVALILVGAYFLLKMNERRP